MHELTRLKAEGSSHAESLAMERGSYVTCLRTPFVLLPLPSPTAPSTLTPFGVCPCLWDRSYAIMRQQVVQLEKELETQRVRLP
jgi:hypothetical protein